MYFPAFPHNATRHTRLGKEEVGEASLGEGGEGTVKAQGKRTWEGGGAPGEKVGERGRALGKR